MTHRKAAAVPAFAQVARPAVTRSLLRQNLPLSVFASGPVPSRARRRHRVALRLFAPALLLMIGLACGCGTPIHQLPPPVHAGWPPAQIKNVVIIFQENRTPDNLFHFLTPACPIPAGASGLQACTPAVSTSCYDVSPCGLSMREGQLTSITLTPIPLGGSVDPDHTHKGFINMCDPDPVTLVCRNDGAWKTTVPANQAYTYVANPAVTNSDGSQGHVLDPYLNLAEQYGWANFMYQTNQGGSYPAHQYIFAGTSAPSAQADANSTFVAETFDSKVLSDNAGCMAEQGATNDLVSPVLSPPASGCTLYANGSVEECPITNTALSYPTNPVGTFCYPHQSMADLLDPLSISWKYYATSPGSIWTAPDSFEAICNPAFVQPNRNAQRNLQCTGPEWNQHVDLGNLGTDILHDIANCSLSQVSWVIPNGTWSDHAPYPAYGPSWVAAIVNAIGNNPQCPSNTPDAGQTYWQNTAIVITWDDWGGWSDNQPATYASQLPCTSADCPGDYEHGFRVPLIMVSAYTPAGYIDNTPYDFGSILRMMEGIYHIPEGALGFADQRATTDLRNFFTLTTPRAFQTIPAQYTANFFLNQWHTLSPADPDDD
jgi:phospholipase C